MAGSITTTITLFGKRHYVAIARVLLVTRPIFKDPSALEQWERDVRVLCALFIADNPEFDLDKFLRSVLLGPKPGGKPSITKT